MPQAKSDPTAQRLFCFGLGYTAAVLTRRLIGKGWTVAGTARSQERLNEIEALGAAAYLFDRGQPLSDPVSALAGTTHILSSVPPDDRGDPVLDHHGDAIAGLAGLRWIGYLCTTGVYGDHGGDWVDEATEPRPGSARSRRRVAAERAWMDLRRVHGAPVHIFRLAGIYGPGRSAIDQLKAGTARRIGKPGQVFSRIHVEDIANVLEASIARPNPGAVYNVCDDEPAPAEQVTAYAAELLGMPPPPLVPIEEADLSPMARSFYADNRRVSNRRIRQELGVALAYPTYREGLRALAGETHGD